MISQSASEQVSAPRPSRRRKWILAFGILAILIIAGLVVAGAVLSRRIEPYARQETIQYLSRRFDSDVALQVLHLRFPTTSPLRLLFTLGRGGSARLEGEGLSLRLKDRLDLAPLFVIQRFRCDVNLDSLLHPPAIVSHIVVDGMEIQIPPRAARPELATPQSAAQQNPSSAGVQIRKVTIRNAGLTLQPADPRRIPLRFDIQSLELQSTAPGTPMKYEASLTNAKPPGQIHATGTFGPWAAGEPGDTPVTGDYKFQQADLAVFAGIAGILHSTGTFEGKLSALTARGQASVPDFRLKMAGNPVPLSVRFTVLVDGTNGNTTLEPVNARLGSTNFTTSGGIIKHERDQPRAISLDMNMPDGDLRDLLRLALKGAPFMEGRVGLKTRIDIPPLTRKVREKLILDGRFEIRNGKFLHSTVQNQIASLSQRAQGEHDNSESGNVVSHMAGAFHLQNGIMQFRTLSFGIPGADLDLAGDYSIESEALDFGGALKLEATVSQMVTGWKKLVLRPVDRFFEKQGAGTFLRIRIDGTANAPKFAVNVAGRYLEAPIPKR